MKSFLVGSVLATGFFSGTSQAASISTTSVGGTVMTFQVEGDFTQNSAFGILCANQNATFIQAKLWMPMHGHGSSPTKIVTTNEKCARVDDLNFLMAGTWEIRVATSTGDTAVFAVAIP